MEMSSRHPILSHSHSVAREAEKIFESLLSSNKWNDVKTPQERDFGIDYRIEGASEGQLRGCEFYAQVKGMSEVTDGQTVEVRIANSTARYWKNKLLPILIAVVDCKNKKGYFSWFDKSVSLIDKNRSFVLHIPRNNELNDTQLEKSLESYYRHEAKQVQNSRKLSFYRELFSQSVLMMHMLLQTNNNLLFAKENGGWKPYERSWLRRMLGAFGRSEVIHHEVRREYLTHYFAVLSIFVHDIQLVQTATSSTAGPLDPALGDLLGRLGKLHKKMYLSSNAEGSIETFQIDENAVYDSLPDVCAILSEIVLFFRMHLLSKSSSR